MMPWSKLPRALRGDWRVTQRTPLALAAFLLAWLAADDVGVIAPVGAESAREALVAQVATLRGATREAAWEAVGECLVAHLLVESEDGMALRLVDWVHDAASARAAAREGEPAPHDGPPRRPGRPAKGGAPMKPRERRVRSAFANREWARFRDVAPGTTFEAWCAAHPEEAAELLRDRNETPERNPAEAANETTADRTKLANETTERNSPGGRAVSGNSGISEPSEDGDQRRGERESGAPDARTKLPNETPERNSRGANETRASRTKLPSVEPLLTLEVDVVLDRMREASKGRLATHVYTSTQAADFGALARDLIGRGQASPETLVRAAAHARHVEWIAKRREPLSLERLTAESGKLLVELLAGAEACAQCGGAPLGGAPSPRPARPAPLAVDRPALAPGEQAAALARLRGRPVPPAPTPADPGGTPDA